MTFLLPGLLGLGAALLALPVLIHLWSRRPAQLVRVGSVKLLGGARPSQARRLALTDVPLLLLRLAILACAGLAAAGLARRATISGNARVALVAPGAASTLAVADSLAAAGWEVRWLDVGLPARVGGGERTEPASVSASDGDVARERLTATGSDDTRGARATSGNAAPRAGQAATGTAAARSAPASSGNDVAVPRGDSVGGHSAERSARPRPAAAVAAWSLLRDAARRFPAADSVLVVAPRTAAALDGARPALPFAVEWRHVDAPAAGTTPMRVHLDLREATPRDSVRLDAALTVVATTANRPLEWAASAAAADVVIHVLPELSAASTDDDPAAPLRYDATLGAWLLPSAALGDPGIVEPLAHVLQLRRDEATTLVLPAAAAESRREPAGGSEAWTSLHAWMAALALALLVVERLVATGQWRPGQAP